MRREDGHSSKHSNYQSTEKQGQGKERGAGAVCSSQKKLIRHICFFCEYAEMASALTSSKYHTSLAVVSDFPYPDGNAA
jgi:hypothetical protein